MTIGSSADLPGSLFLALAGLMALVILRPGLGSLARGIQAAYGRSGLIPVAGDLLVYTMLFAILAWATAQLSLNLIDNYVPERPVALIAPVEIGSADKDNAEGVRLAKLLSANLSSIAVSAERSVPTDEEFQRFKGSQTYKGLPGAEDTKGGFATIFSTIRIGGAPVIDTLGIDSNTKLQVSGTDLTPYVSWFLNRFRRHNALELTILSLKPDRKLIWNSDTARSRWNTMSITTESNDTAIEDFTWTYAHSLAVGIKTAPAFLSLTGAQYRTIVKAYSLFADAIRLGGQRQDGDLSPMFGRILDLLETGVDPQDPPAPSQPAAQVPAPVPAGPAPPPPGPPGAMPGNGTPAPVVTNTAAVNDVASHWWELSKSLAVIASLAGRPDKARTYANIALELTKETTTDRDINLAKTALEKLGQPVKPKGYQKTQNTDIILLSTSPLPALKDGVETKSLAPDIRRTTKGNIDLFELQTKITGPVSALEAVQHAVFPEQATLILDLPLEILKTPALPQLIKEDLQPATTLIYTRADPTAVTDLKSHYPGAKIDATGKPRPDTIRDLALIPPG